MPIHMSGTRLNMAYAYFVEVPMNVQVECEQETDGRWLAEVPQLPGVLAYGDTADEALSRAQVLALRVLAEQLEHGEAKPQSLSITISAA